MRSYDFIFDNKDDSLDFIVAIHQAMLRKTQFLYDNKIKELKSSLFKQFKYSTKSKNEKL